MKKRIAAALLTFFTALFPLGVLAQEPGTDCFSPGLTALHAAAQAEGVEIQAQFAPEAMLSAKRDAISVLSELFERARIVYRMSRGDEAARLEWDGQTLAEITLSRAPDRSVVLGGSLLPFALAAQDEAELYQTLGMNAAFAQAAARSASIVERPFSLPAQSGEITLTQETLDALTQSVGMPRATVAEPIAVSWTVDESGMFEAANLTGAVAPEDGGTPWVLTAAVRMRGDKLTCEAEMTRDAQNTVALSVSVTQERTRATRQKDAVYALNIRLKASGKIDGYARALNVSSKSTNTWFVAEEDGRLTEKIRQSVSIGYTDKTPAAAHVNLSNVSISVKDVGTVQSGGALNAPEANFETAVDVTLGDSTLLKGTLEASMRALEKDGETDRADAATNGEAVRTVALSGMDAQERLEAKQLIQERAAAMMKTIYPTLSPSVQKLIAKGLE